MTRHVLQIAAISLVAIACMFYPFLPGTHDRLAVTLSMMARILGWGGLLLVPIGTTWLIYELLKRKATTVDSHPYKGHYFAIATLAASFVVAAAVALAAATHIGLSLGIGVLLIWLCIFWRIAPAWKQLKTDDERISIPRLYICFSYLPS